MIFAISSGIRTSISTSRITRIGASIIQTTSDIYFFSHTQEEDANLLGIFRNMNPAAYIISPILATLFFLVFPFKYLFLALGVVLLFGFYFIPRLAKKKKETLATCIEIYNTRILPRL